MTPYDITPLFTKASLEGVSGEACNHAEDAEIPENYPNKSFNFRVDNLQFHFEQIEQHQTIHWGQLEKELEPKLSSTTLPHRCADYMLAVVFQSR